MVGAAQRPVAEKYSKGARLDLILKLGDGDSCGSGAPPGQLLQKRPAVQWDMEARSYNGACGT